MVGLPALAHIGGLAVVTRALVTGTPLIVMPAFEAEAVEAAGTSGRATHISLVATALRRIDPSVFTCVLLGGSKAPDVLPPNVVATYGMTETGSGVVYDGPPLEGVELGLRHEDGSFSIHTPSATASPEGEILVRAPMLFRCYRDGSDGRVEGPDGTCPGSPPATPGTGTPKAALSYWAASRTLSPPAPKRSGPTSSTAS